MARQSEVEHNITFPDTSIQYTHVKSTSIPWKVDMSNNGSDKHGAMRVDKRPELIRQSDIDERQESYPLHTTSKCLREYVSSLKLRLNVAM